MLNFMLVVLNASVYTLAQVYLRTYVQLLTLA